MILVDFNQVMMSNMIVMIKRNDYTPEFFRHWVLNTIRSFNVKFKNTYGEMIICCDSRSWRKEYFSYYKMARKLKRQEDDIDWDAVFGDFHSLVEDLNKFFPYKVVKTDGAEADDIIATLTKLNRGGEKTVIVSSDKDFIQLHSSNIRQYCPRKKEMFAKQEISDIGNYLLEHIIKGDTSDGVPNVLSDDDVFVNQDKKQSRMTKKRLEEIKNSIILNQSTKYDSRISRNKKLIDLNEIPSNVTENIMSSYNERRVGNIQKAFTYLVKYDLKELINKIEDFKPQRSEE